MSSGLPSGVSRVIVLINTFPCLVLSCLLLLPNSSYHCFTLPCFPLPLIIPSSFRHRFEEFRLLMKVTPFKSGGDYTIQSVRLDYLKTQHRVAKNNSKLSVFPAFGFAGFNSTTENNSKFWPTSTPTLSWRGSKGKRPIICVIGCISPCLNYPAWVLHSDPTAAKVFRTPPIPTLVAAYYQHNTNHRLQLCH